MAEADATPRIPPQHHPACFGCGDNPAGLHLPKPKQEGAEHYAATLVFGEAHQGGPGLVHGGLLSAALDEACGLLATWYRFPCVTGRIFVHYRRPVPINRPIAVEASLRDVRGRRIHVDGRLGDDSEVLADARAAFVHVPLEHFLVTPEGRAVGEAWRRRLAGE